MKSLSELSFFYLINDKDTDIIIRMFSSIGVNDIVIIDKFVVTGLDVNLSLCCIFYFFLTMQISLPHVVC